MYLWNIYIYIYIYVCVCVWVYICIIVLDLKVCETDILGSKIDVSWLCIILPDLLFPSSHAYIRLGLCFSMWNDIESRFCNPHVVIFLTKHHHHRVFWNIHMYIYIYVCVGVYMYDYIYTYIYSYTYIWYVYMSIWHPFYNP
jgi:hypothetical protein